MCHLAWTLKSKSQQSNAHILSTKSWKMFVLIQLDLEGNSCLDKVLKMGKISNTSWNKKMNTGIPSFCLINPIIQSFRTIVRVYCISNPRIGFGYTIISYYSTSLVYIKPKSWTLFIRSFRTSIRIGCCLIPKIGTNSSIMLSKIDTKIWISIPKSGIQVQSKIK